MSHFVSPPLFRFISALALCVAVPITASAQVETRIGTLEFKDGVPSAETAQKVFDTLDFTRALNVYNNSFRGASALGFKRAFRASAPAATTSSSSN
jgi:hypothetical protein